VEPTGDVAVVVVAGLVVDVESTTPGTLFDFV
jgi:hypothetical protein